MRSCDNFGEKITEDVRNYVSMRIDAVKLALVEHFSFVAGRAIGIIVSLFVALLAMMLFTVALVYCINLLVHSWIWSVVIMGAVYVILAIIFLRSRLFVNMMIGVFSRMFFESRKDKRHE